MRSTALTRARSWTVGILSASAVATAIVGAHLAGDHAAALAADRTGTTDSSTSTGSSGSSGVEQPSNQNVTGSDRHSDDDGGFADDDGEDGGSIAQNNQNDQAAQNGQGSQNNQGSQSQNGFSSPGQLAPGSGAPQVTTRGS